MTMVQLSSLDVLFRSLTLADFCLCPGGFPQATDEDSEMLTKFASIIAADRQEMPFAFF